MPAKRITSLNSDQSYSFASDSNSRAGIEQIGIVGDRNQPLTVIGVDQVLTHLSANKLELFYRLSLAESHISKDSLIECLDYDKAVRKLAPGSLSFLTQAERETALVLLNNFEFFAKGCVDIGVEHVVEPRKLV